MRDDTALPDTCTDALERYLDPAIFKALGDPTRLVLLSRLASASRPQTVTELSSCCGVHLSGVSRHLKMLHDAALIRSERQGREVRYRLDCAALTATLRGMADAIKKQIGSGVVAIVAANDGKAAVVVGVTDDLTDRLDAVSLVRAGAQALGGKGGGGRPDMAQAGGPDAGAADQALAAIEDALAGTAKAAE